MRNQTLKRALLVGLLMLCVIVASAAYSMLASKPRYLEVKISYPPEQTENPKVEVVPIDASWAFWYPDLESVMNRHSTVIVGEVESSNMLDQREGLEALGFTHHKVKVLEVVKGDLQSGDVITVSQCGGIYTSPNGETTNYEFEDDPLMKVGEISLLFLNGPTVQEIVSDKEVYLGTSPQTRFIVENGKVFWMGDVFTDRRIMRIADEVMWVNGRPVETVLARLEEIQESAEK